MQNQSGITLFELVIVMTIVAILATIAIPSFQYVTVSNRIASEVNSLLGDMQYARSEAIKEGQTVTVCPSANPTASPPSCSATTAWQTGWIVFSDPNNSQVVPAANPVILRVQGAFAGTDTFVSDNNVQAVTFNREGFPQSGPIGNTSLINAVTITLHATPPNSQWTRCLGINTMVTNQVGMLAAERVSATTPNCL